MAQHMNMSGQNDGVFTSQRNQEYWSSIFLGLGTCEYLSCDDELTEKVSLLQTQVVLLFLSHLHGCFNV